MMLVVCGDAQSCPLVEATSPGRERGGARGHVIRSDHCASQAPHCTAPHRRAGQGRAGQGSAGTQQGTHDPAHPDTTPPQHSTAEHTRVSTMTSVLPSASASVSGFDFSSVGRNASLSASASGSGMGGFTATSTGTTIVGCIYKHGVVLGADTRATEGPIVADKNCEKIHYIADNIRCCGAGTAADTEFVTALISSNMQLHALNTGRQPRVVTAMTMLKQRLFQYQGHVGAALVLGGYDATGPHLFTVAPHGSTDKLPYVTMGSGSLAAMAVFESGWRKDLEQDDAVALVAAAISSGIFNDLGSGSNVDVAIITKDKTEYLRNYETPNERVRKEQRYGFKKGTTAFTKEQIYNMIHKQGMLCIPRSARVGHGTAWHGTDTDACHAADVLEVGTQTQTQTQTQPQAGEERMDTS